MSIFLNTFRGGTTMKLKSKFNIILLLIWFPVLSMHAQIQRCANPNPLYTVTENKSFKKAAGTIIYVPVIFHVIYDNNGNGNVPETQLQKQVDTLNATYSRAGSQYRFYLSAITRTNNTNWWNINFYERSPGQNDDYPVPSQTEINMTNALAIDPTHAFNIYVSRLLSDLCGWTIYYPWEVSEASKQNGIIIDYRTLPGGEMDYYNYGYTAVHEGGHYLGLYHTFQNDCTPPGDEVDDTPYHDKIYNYLCDDLLDTCPSPGTDPVHNYMNYTDDPCYNNFTAGQIGRIASITGQYKPNLGGTTLVFPSTYIVGNSTSLKIFSGMLLQFTSGSSLTVNGTLNANGVTFTRSGTSGTWGGIVFQNGSSGSVSNCSIDHAVKGIEFNNTSSASITVTSCVIEDNSNSGIYLYNSSPTISYNTIQNNIYHGIHCYYYSSPTIHHNTITGNGNYGVYLNYYSPAYLSYWSSGPGVNKIYENNKGVYANYQCNSFIYWNSIKNNSSYELEGYQPLTIDAEYNWWGVYPPTSSEVYTSNGASIDYSPALSYDPTTSANLSVSSAEGENKRSLGKTDNEIIQRAWQLHIEGKYEEAIQLYSKVLESENNSASGIFALVQIEDCYWRLGRNDFTEFAYKKVHSKTEGKNKLTAVADELINRALMNKKEYKNIISNYEKILEDYSDNESIVKNALYNIGYINYVLLCDKGKAQEYFSELMQKYPDDQLTNDCKLLTGKGYDIKNEEGDLIKEGEEVTEISTEFELLGNYPNPFNPTTEIKFSVPVTSNVKLTIYNMMGQEIKSFESDGVSIGNHSFNWNGRNKNDEQVSSGIYIYRLRAIGNNGQVFEKSAKMMLLK